MLIRVVVTDLIIIYIITLLGRSSYSSIALCVLNGYNFKVLYQYHHNNW
jgi:hypothetical protein